VAFCRRGKRDQHAVSQLSKRNVKVVEKCILNFKKEKRILKLFEGAIPPETVKTLFGP
jgi:hypothetical protein